MSKVDIWMPIFIGDYLRDTAELSDAEHGAYLLLLMHYWQKGGEIGCDVDRLARVARTQPETARFILGYYFTLENGNYKNKRADIEMANADSRRASARDNGLKGGRPSKNNPQETGGLPAANLTPNPQESSSPSPSSSQEEREEKEKSIFLPQLQSNPQKDGAARIEKARTSWNSMAPGIGPPCRLMAITFKPEDTSDCLRIMTAYTDEEILEAMVNYATLSKDPEADTPKYGSFVGFIRGGVEKFVGSANPQETFRVKQLRRGPEKMGALDDRPDATSPEEIAREREEAAEEAMSPEQFAESMRILGDPARLKRALASGQE